MANDGTGDPLRTAMQKLNANDQFLDESKVNISDTLAMLANYINKADTSAMLGNYILSSEVGSDYVAYPDTVAMLS